MEKQVSPLDACMRVKKRTATEICMGWRGSQLGSGLQRDDDAGKAAARPPMRNSQQLRPDLKALRFSSDTCLLVCVLVTHSSFPHQAAGSTTWRMSCYSRAACPRTAYTYARVMPDAGRRCSSRWPRPEPHVRMHEKTHTTKESHPNQHLIRTIDTHTHTHARMHGMLNGGRRAPRPDGVKVRREQRRACLGRPLLAAELHLEAAADGEALEERGARRLEVERRAVEEALAQRACPVLLGSPGACRGSVLRWQQSALGAPAGRHNATSIAGCSDRHRHHQHVRCNQTQGLQIPEKSRWH